MAIDGLNSMSTEQLLALHLQSNGQLTSDGTSSSSISDIDIAFQQVLQNYMSQSSKNNKSSDSGISTEQLLAMSLMSNGQLTDDNESSSRDMSNQVQLSSLLMLKALQDSANSKNSSNGSIESNDINQDCPTGQDLNKILMKVNNQAVGSADFTAPSNVSSADMSKIIEAVKDASKKYGVNENLILAVIKQESNFNSNAVSSAGAKGLMQIMPANFSSVGISDPYNVNQNINGGTQILKQALDRYDGDISMALMAYNAGSGNMQKRGVTSASDLYKMPVETQKYVPSVLNYYKNGTK